jgi:hypothetical protein
VPERSTKWTLLRNDRRIASLVGHQLRSATLDEMSAWRVATMMAKPTLVPLPHGLHRGSEPPDADNHLPTAKRSVPLPLAQAVNHYGQGARLARGRSGLVTTSRIPTAILLGGLSSPRGRCSGTGLQRTLPRTPVLSGTGEIA